jgi:N-methylhydantoinase A
VHHARYGHTMSNPLQILNLRVRGIGRTSRPELPLIERGGEATPRTHREAFDFGSRRTVPFAVYDRAELKAGNSFPGPALIDEGTSTTVVPSGQRVTVDDHGYLHVTLEDAA